MTSATVAAKQPKPLPAPNSDFYEVYETLSVEELATVKKVRTFMETKVAPVITKYWVDDSVQYHRVYEFRRNWLLRREECALPATK